MPKLHVNDPKSTHPLVWLFAIICTILAVAVIFTGLVIFIGYMIIRPRVPFITVTYAHLDKLDYDQVGQMNTQISLLIKAENDNAKAHATFTDLSFYLYFQGYQIAELIAVPFDVLKNRSIELQYVVPSLSIPLEGKAMEALDEYLKKGVISFDLTGKVRTRWRVGSVVGPVKFWSRLSCHLKFLTINGTNINPRCSSKSD